MSFCKRSQSPLIAEASYPALLSLRDTPRTIGWSLCFFRFILPSKTFFPFFSFSSPLHAINISRSRSSRSRNCWSLLKYRYRIDSLRLTQTSSDHNLITNKSDIFAHQFLCFFQSFRIDSSNDNIILYFITFFSPNLSVSTSSTYEPVQGSLVIETLNSNWKLNM